MEVSSVKNRPAPPVHAAKPPQEAKAPPKEVTAKAPEAKKPEAVVNTQGHTTGRLLNVTA